MKKIILYILTPFLLLPMFTSCESMLEEVNYGNPTVNDMLTNESNTVLMVGQAYADLKWVHDHWGYWGVASLTADECVCPIRMPGEHWSDGGYWKSLNTHAWDKYATAFRNIWDSTIAGAVLCNKLIDQLSTVDQPYIRQYIGELEVLRSYYYYMLFDCFGRIPYVETFETKTEPLMEPEKVWSRLVTVLERGARNLPQVNDANRAMNYGRVTQGFAYALLARLYLNAESFGCTPDNIDLSEAYAQAAEAKYMDLKKIESVEDFYTNAVRCCDEVIESGAYSIESDYFANFAIQNENSRENIFVIVEDGNADFDNRSNGMMSNKLRINLLTHHYCLQTAYGMIEKPWSGFCARPEFMALYNETDVRGAGNEYDEDGRHAGTKSEKRWGWFVGNIYGPDGKLLLDENKDDAYIEVELEPVEGISDPLDGVMAHAGARCQKYELDKEGKFAFAENDFVLMRYADVLWMKEEAIVRGGQGASGIGTADFQKMLSRTFAYDEDPIAAFKAAYGDVSSFSLQDICDERGREFYWELIRRRDLIRFGQYDKVQYVTATEAIRKWFPIPHIVIEKSLRDENGNPYWTQTEGY